LGSEDWDEKRSGLGTEQKIDWERKGRGEEWKGGWIDKYPD